VRGLADPVEQEHYVAQVSELIGVSREALLAKLKQKGETPRLRPRLSYTPPPLDKTATDMIRTQNHLLALGLMVPDVRDELHSLRPQMLPEEPARQLLKLLQDDPKLKPDAPALRPLEDYGKMETLLFEELYLDVEPLELRSEVARLRDHLIGRYVKMQKQRIARELQTADEARAQALLTAAKKLDSLLSVK
jgi:DNA primase